MPQLLCCTLPLHRLPPSLLKHLPCEKLCLRVGNWDSRSSNANSSQLIKAISSRKPPPEIYGVITGILCLSLQFIYVSFLWIPWDKNKNADCLAKQALASEAAVMNPSLRGILFNEVCVKKKKEAVCAWWQGAMSDGMRFLILTLFCMCAMLNQITANCNLQNIICISERYEPNTTQMLVQSPVTSILFM